MDLSKHLEFFNPMDLKATIHIIGLGAIGSHLAEHLTRLGCTNFCLYDFDTVEEKNVANQMYFAKDNGRTKLEAIREQMELINPQVKIRCYTNGYTGQALGGYVFLAVDSIELRKEIVKENLINPNILLVMDFRMRLADAQHYAADWTNEKQKQNLLATMNFSDEDADKSTPVSACGTTLSVLPTIKVITALGVSNFINFIKNQALRTTVLIDAFSFDILQFVI